MIKKNNFLRRTKKLDELDVFVREYFSERDTEPELFDKIEKLMRSVYILGRKHEREGYLLKTKLITKDELPAYHK